MEKLFSYVWKNEIERNKAKPGYASLDEHLLRFQMFAKMASPNDTFSSLGGSLWSVGFVESDLLLPKDICWTSDQELNFRLIELLTLKSIAIKALQITFNFHDRERIAPRLYILSKMPQINLWLDSQFPLFPEFEMELLAKLEQEFAPKNNSIFIFWKRLISARNTDLSENLKFELTHLLKTQKRNDKPPLFLHATVPLPFRKLTSISDQKLLADLKNQAEQKTQKKRNQKEFTESNESSKKESVNPILHSFEKMETADDYDGGRRIESGDDELNAHENALDELELNRNTSSGEASSLYQQDSIQIKIQQPNILTADLEQTFQYPEWNEKENQYIKSFCTIFPTHPDQKNESEILKTETLSTYQSLILNWKNKLNALVHAPIWQNKLLDGADLDLDSLVRLKPEFKFFSGRPRIYAEKRKSQKDISIVILADVSYSTDTWVDGKKVIDIIKSSIAVASFVFENIFDRVSVVITNSETRKKINYIELKKFDESWIHFYRRSHEIHPQQYTRLGPAIRHAAQVLIKETSLKQVLILITDGKPTDLDPYEGTHGQKDVKKALYEARQLGLQILTLTVSDFDAISLKKIFEQPHLIKNPDDFCREIFHFTREICSKNIRY